MANTKLKLKLAKQFSDDKVQTEPIKEEKCQEAIEEEQCEEAEEKVEFDESFYDDLLNSLSADARKEFLNKKKVREIEADNGVRFAEAIEAYKKYAYVKSPEDLKEENLYGNALRKTSREYAIPVEELKEALLKEAVGDDGDSTPASEIADNIQEENPGVTDAQANKAASIAKDIAKNTVADLDVIYVEGDLEKAMNRSLAMGQKALKIYQKTGKIDKSLYQNILVIGDVGVGKTERVNAWCARHGVRCIPFKADSLTIDDIKGIPVGEDPNKPGVAKTVTYGTFDPFEAQSDDDLIVLYLDEYNRANPEKRAAWFKFMDEHIIQDPSDKLTNKKFFPNLMFTVATINPYYIKDKKGNVESTDDEEGVVPLSKAEANRFAFKYQLSTQDRKFNRDQMEYFKQKYAQRTQILNDDIEEATANAGRLAIALKLLGNKNFYFNSTEKIRDYHANDEPFLTPRSLTLLLDRCDGTKEDFIDIAEYTIGKENADSLKTFLSDYKDIDNQRNAVWKFWDDFGVELKKPEEAKEEKPEEAEEETAVFSQTLTDYDKLKKSLDRK